MHEVTKMRLPIQVLLKKTVAQFPYHFNDPEYFELFKTYHALFKPHWKYKKNEYRFSYSHYCTEMTIIAKRLDPKFSNDGKWKVLKWKNTLLRQVTSHID